MTSTDKAKAFIEGRYAKGNTTKGMGRPGNTGIGTPSNGVHDDGKMPTPPNGTPNAGTTQSATSKIDSSNYKTYKDMVASYKADIEEVYRGDKYGKNNVSLYNPLNYIGAKNNKNPTWTKIVIGASEGDMSMFSSFNLQIKWLNSGVDSVIEWQWDVGMFLLKFSIIPSPYLLIIYMVNTLKVQ